MAAEDTIFLLRGIFKAAGALGTLDAAAFRAGTRAADASDRVIHDRGTGNIFYDADGSGRGGQILFATVDPGVTLTNVDFFIYS